ncbi:MAG: DNA-3-methyladenine glycosylase family protein [Candidatus Thorarchaeota archaeon]
MSGLHKYDMKLNRPFDLDATVDSWIYSDIQPTPEIKQPGMFARCFHIENTIVPVRIIQIRKEPKARLEIQWPKECPERESAILDLTEWLLGLDIDTQLVLKEIQADPVIAHLSKPLEGLRPFSQPTFFEALVKAILQQQVSYRSASQVTRRLVETYGPRCRLVNDIFYGFPSLDIMSSLSEADLRACKVGYKAPYLVELFHQLVYGRTRLEKLAQHTSSEIIAVLDKFRGVGVWTAELAVLTGLRRLEVFPSDDLGIRAIISKLYLNGKPARRKDVENTAARWGKEGSMVLYFLMCAQVLGIV